MYLEIADGVNPVVPAVHHEHRPDALVRLRPMYESQMTPQKFDTDNFSTSYGDPTEWQFQEGSIGDRNEDTGRSMPVHPDRVVYWAEGAGRRDDIW